MSGAGRPRPHARCVSAAVARVRGSAEITPLAAFLRALDED
jgi:hypothetical protein